jgi:glycosyltransferase involved in cell wall biosynthesis
MDLVEAMESVSERLPESHLFIVGSSGFLEEELREAVRDKDLEDHVTITGYVEDLYAYYARADAFVSSSVAEGLPITLLEAMSAGLPLVGTDILGVREVIDDGRTGVLVPHDDPAALAAGMRRLREESVRREFGRRNYDRARREFNIENTVETYLDLYEEVLARRN